MEFLFGWASGDIKKASASAAISTIAFFALVSQAPAATLYGVSASGQATYTLPGAAGLNQSYTTGAFLQQTSYSQPVNYGGQGSTVVTVNNNSYTDTAAAYVSTQASSYGQLHEGTKASSSSPAPGVAASATASSYLAWLDTISFAGAPAGSTVVVQLTTLFDGSLLLSGSVGTGTAVGVSTTLFNQAQNVGYSNSYSTNQPSINVSQAGQLTTTVGSTFTLEEQLSQYISGSQTFSGNADFSNTLMVYLDVLTPGVTLVSSSGANYATPAAASAVPEPTSMFLAGIGVIAVGALRNSRSKRA